MTDLGVAPPTHRHITSSGLYHRHAAGLFAYCCDQLGDQGSAHDVLMTVLAMGLAQEPPRAALYSLARREIHRRDVVYAPPVVDPLVDPACALVERAFRELRPHQREVLLLCEVCGLDRTELAWVLDVATDTADELAASARLHFQHALDTALNAVSVRLVTASHEVLRLTPLRDTLRRLPWPAPPEPTHEAGQTDASTARGHSGTARGAHAVTPAVPLWPLSPTWPLPLAETDPLTNTGIFPTELLKPRIGGKAEHEATTAPMPKYRDGFVLAAPVNLDRPSAEVRARIDGILGSLQKTFEVPVPARGEPGDVLVAGSPEDSLFQPRPAAAPPGPVYILPEEAPSQPEKPEKPEKQEKTEKPKESGPQAARPAPARTAKPQKAPTGKKQVKRHYPKHHDWAWELIGFLICVAIAMAVFFSIPTISG